MLGQQRRKEMTGTSSPSRSAGSVLGVLTGRFSDQLFLACWRFGFWVGTEEIFHQGAIESLENLSFNWVLLFFSL
jgi:hypothetical protein